MNIITLQYKDTNSYLVPCKDGWLLVDAGWPDTLSQFLQLLNQNNILLNDITYLVVTHFHPGHAGLTQNLKDYGIRLLLHNSQIPYVAKINAFFKKNPEAKFKDITPDNTIILSDDESKSFLKEIGIDGELVQTPGHSDDSISLVIDQDCAFIGDLPAYYLEEASNDLVILDSWEFILSHGVKLIYPSHEEPYEIVDFE